MAKGDMFIGLNRNEIYYLIELLEKNPEYYPVHQILEKLRKVR